MKEQEKKPNILFVHEMNTPHAERVVSGPPKNLDLKS
jgi:hypothetical protein